LLQILSGEMELLCNIEINGEIKELSGILDTGINKRNWERVISSTSIIYEKIFIYCCK